MIHAPVSPEHWAAEGARTAGALTAAESAQPDGAWSPDLLDCIRDELPVAEIARPHSEDGRVFILPRVVRASPNVSCSRARAGRGW